LKTLEKTYFGSLIQPDIYDDLIHKAATVSVSKTTLKWDDWDRFSGSQKVWMKFGGLTGSVTYAGDLQPFYDLLTLGEWLHIGNKTNFGLGKYELSTRV